VSSDLATLMALEPASCRGNPSQIFLNLLFPDIAHWYLAAFAVGDRDTEDALAQEDAFSIHAEQLGRVSKSVTPARQLPNLLSRPLKAT
jgi:hypothetical protein